MMKKVRFDEKLENLVDESDVKYEGKRFKTVSVSDNLGYKDNHSAELSVESALKKIAISHKADAYEIVHLTSSFSDRFNRRAPYNAQGTAILYKSSNLYKVSS